MDKNTLQTAHQVADEIEQFLSAFNQVAGIPTDIVIAAALGQASALAAVRLGPKETAVHLRRLADQIEAIQSQEDLELAVAHPAGRA